jgi:Fe-Mn family superoxide dismutase
MKTILIFLLTSQIVSNSVFAQFVQEPLPYAYNALEPYIDTQTMEIHFTKHHATYINNLNNALKEAGLTEETDLNKILSQITKYNTVIRNNAGGHYNHTFFWKLLTGEKNMNPSGELLKALEATFGNIDKFKTEFNKAAASRFGSGWAWLIISPDKKLVIISTPNQDNPLMEDVPIKGVPVLCVDVWEHAYYLKYQNRRTDYLQAFWNIVNWKEAESLYEKAMAE